VKTRANTKTEAKRIVGLAVDWFARALVEHFAKASGRADYIPSVRLAFDRTAQSLDFDLGFAFGKLAFDETMKRHEADHAENRGQRHCCD